MRRFLWCLLFVSCLFFVGCSKTDVNGGNKENGSNGDVEKTYYSIVFEQGDESVIKTVQAGETLTDIPEITQSRRGYAVAWSVSDFTSVSSDLTVTLVYTPMESLISYDLGECPNASIIALTQTVVFDQAFTLYVPYYETAEYEYVFVKWLVKSARKEFKSGVCDFTQNVELVAVWDKFTPSFPIN